LLTFFTHLYRFPALTFSRRGLLFCSWVRDDEFSGCRWLDAPNSQRTSMVYILLLRHMVLIAVGSCLPSAASANPTMLLLLKRSAQRKWQMQPQHPSTHQRERGKGKLQQRNKHEPLCRSLLVCIAADPLARKQGARDTKTSVPLERQARNAVAQRLTSQ
jgi:hypothetical protein